MNNMIGYMATLQTAVECLRPFVKINAWDYCIIWKLGDDPSRFIEWEACCCSGGNTEQIKIKRESDNKSHLVTLCRDTHIKHSVRTKACKELAQFPSTIGLYPGIHGEVVISKQPRWLFRYDASSKNLQQPVGTQVLIPLPGRLIELFSTKHVPKNEKIINFISAQFKLSLEEEDMSKRNYPCPYNLIQQHCDSYSKNLLNGYSPSFHYTNMLPPVSQPNNDCSGFGGSPTSSNLTSENLSLNLAPGHVLGNTSHGKSCRIYSEVPRSNLSLKRKLRQDSASSSENEIKSLNACPTPGKEYQSKNLITERNRRRRIKDGLYALRALVPNITKMDRAATLGDAADYIQELEKTIESYQEELRAIEEECNNLNAKPEIAKLEREPAEKQKSHFSTSDTAVNVEVTQIRSKEFMLKFICKKKQGGFTQLMEAMDSVGLQVTDANVTTLNSSVLNVLRVQVNKEISQKDLKHLMIQLTN